MKQLEITAEMARELSKQAVRNYIVSLRNDIMTAANDGKVEINIGYGMNEVPGLIAYYEEKGFNFLKKEKDGSERTFISWE